MKRLVLGAMRLVVGMGGAIFLAFAVAASLLTFFQYQAGSLMLDHSGPYWRYGRLAMECWSTSGLWWLMWRLLPAAHLGRRGTRFKRPATERTVTIGLLTTTSF